MFNIGDTIFYPLKGVGKIVSKEVQVNNGIMIDYYHISFPIERMNLRIPTPSLSSISARPIATKVERDESRKNFFQVEENLLINPAQRYNDLYNIMKSGVFQDEVRLIRNLICFKKKRELQSQDRSILKLACKLFIHELMYIEDISYDFASLLLKEDIELRITGGTYLD